MAHKKWSISRNATVFITKQRWGCRKEEDSHLIPQLLFHFWRNCNPATAIRKGGIVLELHVDHDATSYHSSSRDVDIGRVSSTATATSAATSLLLPGGGGSGLVPSSRRHWSEGQPSLFQRGRGNEISSRVQLMLKTVLIQLSQVSKTTDSQIQSSGTRWCRAPVRQPSSHDLHCRIGNAR